MKGWRLVSRSGEFGFEWNSVASSAHGATIETSTVEQKRKGRLCGEKFSFDRRELIAATRGRYIGKKLFANTITAFQLFTVFPDATAWRLHREPIYIFVPARLKGVKQGVGGAGTRPCVRLFSVCTFPNAHVAGCVVDNLFGAACTTAEMKLTNRYIVNTAETIAEISAASVTYIFPS